MEPFLADLINNPKVPKIIRYIIVSIASLFLIFAGIICVIESPMIIGKVFGIIFCTLILIVTFYLLRKIYKN